MDPRDEAITLIASQTHKTQLCILHYSLFLRLMEEKMMPFYEV